MGAFIEYLRRRATSTVLIAYSAFWAILHWEGIYVTLFVGQDEILEQYHMLKNEYVNTYFFGLHLWTNQFWWALLQMLLPIVLAYLYVWWLPKLTNLCYKREIGFKMERRKMKFQAEAEVAEAQQEATQKQNEQVKAEIELKQNENTVKELSPEEVWDAEFTHLSGTHQGVVALNDLKRVVYENGGFLTSSGERQMLVDSQMLCDSYSLMQKDPGRNVFTLTDKGRYFMKCFAEKTNSPEL